MLNFLASHTEINTTDGKINIPNNLTNVYIDIGLSWWAPHSVDWCKNTKNTVVFGFEPSPIALDSIHSIQKNGFISSVPVVPDKNTGSVVQNETQEFHIIPCALGNKNGKVSFHQTITDVGTSSLYKPKDPKLGDYDTISINLYKLKDFFDLFPWDTHPYISYIKIDAQGSDLDILKGAGKYLVDKVVYVTAEGDGRFYYDSDIIQYMTSIGFDHINHHNTKDPTFLNPKYRDLGNIYISQSG
jgi:FkbM family methyltransferase